MSCRTAANVRALVLLCVFLFTQLSVYADNYEVNEQFPESSKPSESEVAELTTNQREPIAQKPIDETLAQTSPLDRKRIREILSRMPDMKSSDRQEKQPTLAVIDQLPPPQPGKVADALGIHSIAQSNASFKVAAFSPQGDVPAAATITVSFTRPMVPLSEVGAASRKKVPVLSEPPLIGEWRWLDSRTASFQCPPHKLLPLGTNFKMRVPAGTTSLSGESLAGDATWTFSTPAISEIHFLQESYQLSLDFRRPGLDEPLILYFDQKIDPDKILPYIDLREIPESALRRREEPRSDEGRKIFVRLASAAEQKHAIEQFKISALSLVRERLLFLKPLESLKAKTGYSLFFKPGLPSEEGALRSKKSISVNIYREDPSFFVGPDQTKKNYPAGEPWYINFSHDIDPTKLKKSMVRVEPPLPHMKLFSYYEELVLTGDAEPGRTYTVILDGAISDSEGKSLKRNHVISILVGDATPNIIAPRSQLVMLEPKPPKRFDIYSINQNELKIQGWKVDEKDYKKVNWAIREPSRAPDFLVQIPVNNNPNKIVATPFDLEPYLSQGLGHVILKVSGGIEPKPKNEMKCFKKDFVVWIEASQINLRAQTCGGNILCWATDSETKQPLENVEICLSGDARKIQTDQDGLALLTSEQKADNGLIIARKGNDMAMLPDFLYRSTNRPGDKDTLEYGFTDRPLYRPGEQVHYKGWVKNNFKNSNSVSTPAGAEELLYSCTDSRDGKIANGKCVLSRTGGFNLQFDVPIKASLGDARLKLKYASRDLPVREFTIEEFRTPEYRLGVETDETGPKFEGDTVKFLGRAQYYGGGPLSDAKLYWSIAANRVSFQPPGWPEYCFQDQALWNPSRYLFKSTESHSNGKTNDSGLSQVDVSVNRLLTHQPVLLSGQADVRDLNNRQVLEFANVFVHPARLYVGLKYLATTPGSHSTTASVSVVVTDINGKAVPGQEVKILTDSDAKLSKLDLSKPVMQTVRSGEVPVQVSIPLPDGWCRISALVQDDRGHQNRASLINSGDEENYSIFPNILFEREQAPSQDLRLEPDKSKYLPGETAILSVNSPYESSVGVLAVSNKTNLNRRLVRLKRSKSTSSCIIDIPIKESYGAGCHVNLVLYPDGENSPYNICAKGECDLAISTESKKLSISTSPDRASISPGEQCKINVHVADHAGNPVKNVEVALSVVDEAILALSDKKILDPLDTFYPESRSYEQEVIDLRLHMPGLLQTVADLYHEALRAVQLHGRVSYSKMGPFTTPRSTQPRKSFNPLALFSPRVYTDGNGDVSVPLTAPDSLTTYKITAVAADDGGRFGLGVSSLKVEKPIVLRPIAPRFLYVGDKFNLPVVAENNSSSNVHLEAAARVSGKAAMESGFAVDLIAHKRSLLLVPFEALTPGDLQLQLSAEGDGTSLDSLHLVIPVERAVTQEEVAVCNTADGVSDVFAEAVSHVDAKAIDEMIDVQLSSTAGTELNGALDYLRNYRFNCTEQVASRMLATAEAFSSDRTPKDQKPALRIILEQDTATILRRQMPAGWIELWDRGEDRHFEQNPICTLHGINALISARNAGIEIPDSAFKYAKEFCNDYYLRIKLQSGKKSKESASTKFCLMAYCAYIENLLDQEKESQCLTELCKIAPIELPLCALAWMLPSLHRRNHPSLERVRQVINNSARQTTSTCTFKDLTNDPRNLLCTSDIRLNALVLSALLIDSPESSLIPKLANGLLISRRNGTWSNTSEDAFCVLALNSYFDKFEGKKADFICDVWFDQSHVKHSIFKPGTEQINSVSFPFAGSAKHTVLMQKLGTGRLYYRVGMKYLLPADNVNAVSEGFSVTRTYEGATKSDEVKTDEHGVVHIKNGAMVRVKVNVVNNADSYHVALTDSLPGGLEPVHSELNGYKLGRDSLRSAIEYGWSSMWFDHQNLRDHGAEAFVDSLELGTYCYSYLVKAHTSGQFVAPPARVEEMYTPETFGHSASNKVVIFD